MSPAMPPTFRVSARNPHRLETLDGAPYFLLGDTAWELFHRLTIEESEHYLATRARQGFRTIFAVALAEFDGLRTPNRYGEVPFHYLDPMRPNEAYFNHIDHVIGRAAAHGLGVSLLPTWADKVTPNWGDGPIVFPLDDLTPARAYGEFLGRRYRDQAGLLWVLGGDRPAVHGETDYRPIWRAMAAGIRAGGATQPMTYHPQGGRASTSVFLHEEPWLDFNAMQSGHGGGRDIPVWEMVSRDLTTRPPKPTLDMEPNYEDHPVSPWPKWDPANGYFDDHDVRKQSYRSVFAGACGVVYGHHSIWQFADLPASWINHAKMGWQEALTRPGAESIHHLRTLLETPEWFDLEPATETVLPDPGEGPNRAAAMQGPGLVLIYRPNGRALQVRPGFKTMRAVRIDPLTGAAVDIAVDDGSEFILPAEEGDQDAVFRLESTR